MRIGILGGTGRMGSGLARGYHQAGHEVILGSRQPMKAEKLANEIGTGVSGASLQSAAQNAELIVLAIGFRDVSATLRLVHEALRDRIVVDITNPFGAVPPGATSGIEENRKLAPAARWVAAYKTTFWKTLDQPALADGTQHDILVCSDDDDAKRCVMHLIEDTGFRAVDCGKLQNARTLDLMVPLMLELDQRYVGEALTSWKFMNTIQQSS